LAAFSQWHGGSVRLTALLGHAERPDAPLLRASAEGPVDSIDEARALGERAAAALRGQGAGDYLLPA